MNKFFQKVPTTKPKLYARDLKNKRKLLLSAIGGKGYVDCLWNPTPPNKNPHLSKKVQEEEEKTKLKLKGTMDHCCNCKFQVN